MTVIYSLSLMFMLIKLYFDTLITAHTPWDMLGIQDDIHCSIRKEIELSNVC